MGIHMVTTDIIKEDDLAVATEEITIATTEDLAEIEVEDVVIISATSFEMGIVLTEIDANFRTKCRHNDHTLLSQLSYHLCFSELQRYCFNLIGFYGINRITNVFFDLHCIHSSSFRWSNQFSSLVK